jgi:hypothetical protein
MVKNARRLDVISGAALSILGVYILFTARKWEFIGVNGPGPGFFPFVYGLIMLVAASALTINALRSSGGQTRAEPSEPATDRGGLVAAMLTLGALAASLPLMWVLGFVIGFGLVLFFILRFVFGRPLLGAAITAAAIVLALHLTFPVLLGSPLPTGVFWDF